MLGLSPVWARSLSAGRIIYLDPAAHNLMLDNADTYFLAPDRSWRRGRMSRNRAGPVSAGQRGVRLQGTT